MANTQAEWEVNARESQEREYLEGRDIPMGGLKAWMETVGATSTLPLSWRDYQTQDLPEGKQRIAWSVFPTTDEALIVRSYIEELGQGDFQGYFHAFESGGSDGVTSKWFDAQERSELEARISEHLAVFTAALGFPVASASPCTAEKGGQP